MEFMHNVNLCVPMSVCNIILHISRKISMYYVTISIQQLTPYISYNLNNICLIRNNCDPFPRSVKRDIIPCHTHRGNSEMSNKLLNTLS